MSPKWKVVWGGITGIIASKFKRKPSLKDAIRISATANRTVNMKSKVSVVKGTNISNMLVDSVNLLGGAGILPGSIVLIKVNQNSDDPFPATSSPEFISSLVTYLKQFNPARIVVADASFAGFLPTLKTMKRTGVYQAATEAGAEVLGFEESEFLAVIPEGAENWVRPFRVARIYLEADYVISQPVVKTHKHAIYSMALKNAVGALLNSDRSLMHSASENRFWKMIAEINLVRRPDLILLDGRKAMVTGGPFSGEIKEAGYLIATRDLIAADAIGLAILKYLGTTERIENHSIWDVPVLKRATEIGLGARSVEEIEIVSQGLSEDEYQKIFNFLKR